MRIKTLRNVFRNPARSVEYSTGPKSSHHQTRLRIGLTIGLLALSALLVDASSVGAQFSEVEGAIVEDAGPAQVIRSRSSSPNVSTPSTPPSSSPSKPSLSSSKPDEKKGESKDGKKEGDADKTSDVVKRPTEPDSPANPDELDATPNEAGMLRLNFQGQPWPGVISWLKKVSGKSLDWQELPGGYLNLSTHREYTVEEARNIINRHLLARGYTILIRDELMTVEKIEKLNPAMVPRVTAAELDQRGDYEFVKVSFTLTALVAAQAAE